MHDLIAILLIFAAGFMFHLAYETARRPGSAYALSVMGGVLLLAAAGYVMARGARAKKDKGEGK